MKQERRPGLYSKLLLLEQELAGLGNTEEQVKGLVELINLIKKGGK